MTNDLDLKISLCQFTDVSHTKFKKKVTFRKGMNEPQVVIPSAARNLRGQFVWYQLSVFHGVASCVAIPSSFWILLSFNDPHAISLIEGQHMHYVKMQKPKSNAIFYFLILNFDFVSFGAETGWGNKEPRLTGLGCTIYDCSNYCLSCFLTTSQLSPPVEPNLMTLSAFSRVR